MVSLIQHASLLMLLAFIVGLSVAEVGSLKLQDNIQNSGLLLEYQVGEHLVAAYRSLFENRTTFSNGKSANIPRECFVDLNNIKSNPKKFLKYIDSAGKPRSGILQGNFAWLGSYSGCLAMSDSQYCLSYIHLNIFEKNLSVIWGSCFPKSWSQDNIKKVLEVIIQKVKQAVPITEMQLSDFQCPGGPTYSDAVKGILVFFSFLSFFCVIGTFIDVVIGDRDPIQAAQDMPYTNDGFTENYPLLRAQSLTIWSHHRAFNIIHRGLSSRTFSHPAHPNSSSAHEPLLPSVVPNTFEQQREFAIFIAAGMICLLTTLVTLYHAIFCE